MKKETELKMYKTLALWRPNKYKVVNTPSYLHQNDFIDPELLKIRNDICDIIFSTQGSVRAQAGMTLEEVIYCSGTPAIVSEDWQKENSGWQSVIGNDESFCIVEFYDDTNIFKQRTYVHKDNKTNKMTVEITKFRLNAKSDTLEYQKITKYSEVDNETVDITTRYEGIDCFFDDQGRISGIMLHKYGSPISDKDFIQSTYIRYKYAKDKKYINYVSIASREHDIREYIIHSTIHDNIYSITTLKPERNEGSRIDKMFNVLIHRSKVRDNDVSGFILDAYTAKNKWSCKRDKHGRIIYINKHTSDKHLKRFIDYIDDGHHINGDITVEIRKRGKKR